MATCIARSVFDDTVREVSGIPDVGAFFSHLKYQCTSALVERFLNNSSLNESVYKADAVATAC